MPNITITGLKELQDRIARFPEISEKHIDLAIKRSFVRLMGGVKGVAPVGVTGQLRDRWNIQVSRFQGKMSSGVPYAFGVEYGTSPHYVPASSLDLWARNRGLNPYAISHAIAKKGTKANPFFQASIDSVRTEINKEFKTALVNITKALGK